MKNKTTTKNRIGIATFINNAAGEKHTMAYDINRGYNSLSQAWKLVNTVASLKGWLAGDVFVKVVK